jgi:hypothetical protein
MRVLTALAAIAVPVLACECRHLSVCELIQMPTVFIGEVIDGGVTSIRDDPWNSNVKHVRFRVLENFRGLPANAQTVDVELTPTARMFPRPRCRNSRGGSTPGTRILRGKHASQRPRARGGVSGFGSSGLFTRHWRIEAPRGDSDYGYAKREVFFHRNRRRGSIPFAPALSWSLSSETGVKDIRA